MKTHTLVLLAVASCSCRHEPIAALQAVAPPTLAIAPPPPTAVSSATALSGASLRRTPQDAGTDPCAPFAAKARAEFLSKLPPFSESSSPDSLAVDICVPVKDGVWAVEYRDATARPTQSPSGYGSDWTEVRATWRLVRAYADGHRLLGTESQIEVAPFSVRGFGHVTSAFDYDGDGEDEVLLGTDSSNIYGGITIGTLWTVRNGMVTPFLPAQGINIEGLEDVDDDGRPDIVTLGPYQPESAPLCTDGNYRQVFSLIAHSTSTGFSFTDRVAADYAKKLCPRPPGKLDINPDLVDSLSAVRCARLWGMSSADALRAIHAKCQHQLENPEGLFCPERVRNACLLFDVLESWAKATPPLRLKP